MARIIVFAEVPDFYAAIERRDGASDDPRPVLVGGDPRRRGEVQSATPDARAAGVAIGMPMIEALRLCPRARTVRTDVARYNEVSRRLMACLRRGFQRLEPFGRSSAYFDVTGVLESGEDIAERLRVQVREGLGLPLRVGIASGKSLARLAAQECQGADGEGGVHRIPAGTEEAFLGPLPASLLEGVGQKTTARLAELGATTIRDVVAMGRGRLEEEFGRNGLRIFAFASGRDDAPVRATRHPKSLSREATVRGEGLDQAALSEYLQNLAHQLAEELLAQGLCASRVILKLRYEDQVTTRSRTLAGVCRQAAEIQEVAAELLSQIQGGARSLRGLGIQLSKLAPAAEAGRQLELFSRRR